MPGRFFLGLGTGERLNEHVMGQRWPTGTERRAMLREAIGMIRDLWSGKTVSRRGKHFTVEQAELFTPARHAAADRRRREREARREARGRGGRRPGRGGARLRRGRRVRGRGRYRQATPRAGTPLLGALGVRSARDRDARVAERGDPERAARRARDSCAVRRRRRARHRRHGGEARRLRSRRRTPCRRRSTHGGRGLHGRLPPPGRPRPAGVPRVLPTRAVPTLPRDET